MSEIAALLVDTHVWWRWRNEPDKLSRPQTRSLVVAERRHTPVGVSAISLWELAQMVSRGRVRIHEPLEDWINRMAGHPLIEVLPITPSIAAEAAQLGEGAPPDPADRLIIATARCHSLKLLTADERIRNWGVVPVV
jgi:PIN domain nuclease of toxin-antitoxin system